jgi:Ca2+-binding EF-hand superfamily protein
VKLTYWRFDSEFHSKEHASRSYHLLNKNLRDSTFQRNEKQELNSYFFFRKNNLEELKLRYESSDVLYPSFTTSTSISDFIEKWSHLSAGEVDEKEIVTLCGTFSLSLFFSLSIISFHRLLYSLF